MADDTTSLVGDVSDHAGFATDIFKLAFDVSPFGMMLIASEGSIIAVNHEVERIFGYVADDLVGRFADLLAPMRLRGRRMLQHAPAPQDASARQIGARGDLFGLRSDGSEFLLEASVTPIPARNGPLTLAVIADASARRRLEQLKHDFVSTASHELRTPLTSIAGSLALLLRETDEPLSKPATRLIRIAHDNSQRLVRLINDVLDLEKIESGSVVFALQRIDLKSFLEQVADANRPYADSRAVTIRIDSAAMLDSIDTDPDWLAQVVTNLLSNAIRFSPPGGDIAVSAGLHDDCARISVRDHGPGVPPDFRSRLFERFARADSSANHKASSGLGLSIVQEIVARLGGQASFDDAPGGGAIFHVDLPLRDRRRTNAMTCFEDAAE